MKADDKSCNISSLTTEASEYLTYPIDSKLNYLRQISKDITYNDNLRHKILSNHFHSIILQDLPNNPHQTYVRLFFMFLHNSIPFESKAQLDLFKDIFITHHSILSNLIFTDYPTDIKLHKFLLGIIYKFFIHNSIIMKDYLLQNNLIEFYIKFSLLISKQFDPEKIKEDNDLMEINDWLHIIYEYLLQNDEIINEETGDNFLITILKSYHLIFIELIRDITDHAKENKVLLISRKNIDYLIELFNQQLNFLTEKFTSGTMILTLITYKSFEEDDSLIVINRRFLCLVDVFSVILTTEDLNKNEYTKAIHKKLSKDEVYMQIISLLKMTDDIYEKIYKRNKALNEEELKVVPNLNQSSFLFCFQTNMMKFLSNFAYQNEHMKQFFINHSIEFYYLLNHMKIDKCNPFKKEWSVLFVKSLCDKCYKIQEMIAQLKPVEMDPLLKDYVINKGTHVQIGPGNKIQEFNFDLLTKK